MRLTERFAKRLYAALLIMLLAACTSIESPRPGSTSIDLGPAATAPSAGGLTGDERQVSAESSLLAIYQDPASKTERVIGIVALGALIVGLGIVVMGLYKLFQALG